MEMTAAELIAVQQQEAAATVDRQQRELNELQLVLLGGGCGDTILI